MLADINNHAGLSNAEARKRLVQFGPNEAAKQKEVSFVGIAKEEVKEPLILLLIAVGFFYSIWGDFGDVVTIFAVVSVVIFVEVWNEYRAKKTISSLAKLAAPRTKVVREGKITEVRSEEIVPGDILVLTSGTRISADSKILATYGGLQLDESPLTGESFPKDKVETDEVYAGTLVISGEGKAEVFITGKSTKFGKISAIAREIKEPKTPLQLSMKSLAKSLVWVAIFFSVLIPLMGFLRGEDFRQMVLTGLSLAFATIPEELPIIITIILGLGAYQLSKKNFLVKKIKTAEVLGNATVILSDKTGTITENKMRVAFVFPDDKGSEIMASALASLTDISHSPTDQAILDEARRLNVTRDVSLASNGKVNRQRSLGNGKKTKAVIREMNNGNLQLFVIGAPEEILAAIAIEYNKTGIEKVLVGETAKGRRVIALAKKCVFPADKDQPFPHLESDLEFVGLISIEDPPRPGVKETIDVSHQAGIRTIMVTGDHPQTALFIAKSVGIAGEDVLTGNDLGSMSDEKLQSAVKRVSVFARASPEHKYRILKALQANGEVVAVTGDGINDTLALKGADIGISMGVKGTDAAKEAADVVLVDDNFVSIGHGIFEGRKVFDNFRKAIKYYLSAKVALISVFLVPILLNIPFPFAPIQIIILELFMDLGASAAFVSERAESAIYTRPPRNPRAKFLDSSMVRGIFVSGFSLFAAVFVSYLYALQLNLPFEHAQTFAFAAWIIGHIVLAYISRSEVEPLAKMGVFSNKIMNLWAIAVSAFLLVPIVMPKSVPELGITSISPGQLLIILGLSFPFIAWLEVKKFLRTRPSHTAVRLSPLELAPKE